MIYFVRHGSTEWNLNIGKDGTRDPKMQGRSDIPLHEIGINQAKETSEKLKNIKFDKVFCSPLTRAKQTCEIVNLHKTKVIYDERLMERDFGEYEGKVKSSYDFNRFFNNNVYDTYISAETIHQMKARVYSFLDDIKQYKDETILVVAHGGVGMIMRSYFEGLPKDGNFVNYLIPNGKIMIFNY